MRIDRDLIAASSTPLALAIVAEGESYGYAIPKRVRELSCGDHEWIDGMQYPLLHRLSGSRWGRSTRSSRRVRRPPRRRPRARPVRDVLGDPSTPPGWMGRAQLVAVVSALALDGMVLVATVARIGELGFTPNRTVALGLNPVLMVNLAGAAWLSVRFLQRRAGFQRLERWQTAYLAVFAVWAGTVVVVVPRGLPSPDGTERR